MHSVILGEETDIDTQGKRLNYIGGETGVFTSQGISRIVGNTQGKHQDKKQILL